MTLKGIKKTHQNKKYFSEQEKFPGNIHIFFYTLIFLKHHSKRRRRVGFLQKAICFRGHFARYENVVCGLDSQLGSVLPGHNL